MSNEKSELWQQLKERDATFDKPYQQYTIAELQQMLEDKPSEGVKTPPDQLEDFFADIESEEPSAPEVIDTTPEPAPPPLAEADPDELPGQRLNTKEEWEPIRTDDAGRIWYQEEVLKPGYAKPRGRRVLNYTDTGVEKQTVRNGEYIEEFEVAGHEQGRPVQVKITLPSYQTGIYKDPRYPFKIHTYNGNNGFDFAEVAEYYGGTDRVPTDIKRVYVENDLCWDIRTTIRTIEAEYRHLQLTGRIR